MHKKIGWNWHLYKIQWNNWKKLINWMGIGWILLMLSFKESINIWNIKKEGSIRNN
jgi:hypothetical protein